MTRRSTFENLSMWKREFLLQADTTFRGSSPFVIIGTKCDRIDIEISPEEVVLKGCVYSIYKSIESFDSEDYWLIDF